MNKCKILAKKSSQKYKDLKSREYSLEMLETEILGNLLQQQTFYQYDQTIEKAKLN